MAKRTTVPSATRAPYVGWDQFTDGEWWELTKGDDFRQEAHKAARAARQWAAVHGYRCKAHVVKDGEAVKVRFEKVIL